MIQTPLDKLRLLKPQRDTCDNTCKLFMLRSREAAHVHVPQCFAGPTWYARSSTHRQDSQQRCHMAPRQTGSQHFDAKPAWHMRTLSATKGPGASPLVCRSPLLPKRPSCLCLAGRRQSKTAPGGGSSSQQAAVQRGSSTEGYSEKGWQQRRGKQHIGEQCRPC